MCGRGLLRKWGPNLVAHPVLTREDPQRHRLQVLALRRGPERWELPSGMVGRDESMPTALRREIEREIEQLAGDLSASEGETL